MNHRMWIAICLGASLSSIVVSAAPRATIAARQPRPSVKRAASIANTRSMTPSEARMAVAMLDDAYQLILEETHATYHTQPNQPVAATIVRKLQERMNQLGWPRARFMAVNAVVMHPAHTPRDDFDRRAIQTLRSRDARVEEVVGGKLRVATVVPTGGRCGSCHWAPSGQASKAAITWSVPLSPMTRGR